MFLRESIAANSLGGKFLFRPGQNTRDNVVFELGLFMGDVGPERAFVVKPRGVTMKIPTDLLGMKSLEYDASDPSELTTALAPVCNEIRKRVAALGMK